MAAALGADHVLCTPIEVRDGVITGRTAGARRCGARARRAARCGSPASRASTSTSALRLLQRRRGRPVPGGRRAPGRGGAGRPAARGGRAPRLAGAAAASPRGGRPGCRRLARTGALLRRVGRGLRRRASAWGCSTARDSRRREITGGIGSDLGLALAGIDVDVVAARSTCGRRGPCVFVFNHQSKIDAARAHEAAARAASPAWRRRRPRTSRLRAVLPARRRRLRRARQHRAGRRSDASPRWARCATRASRWCIAPEGTRSPTPRLGPFKKGAFHIAMQAGVPMVPIVIRDAGEVHVARAQTLRRGHRRGRRAAAGRHLRLERGDHERPRRRRARHVRRDAGPLARRPR